MFWADASIEMAARACCKALVGPGMDWAQSAVSTASATVALTGVLFVIIFLKWRSERYLLFFGASSIFLGLGYYLAYSVLAGHIDIPVTQSAAVLFVSGFCLAAGACQFAGKPPEKLYIGLLVFFAAAIAAIYMTDAPVSSPLLGLPMSSVMLLAAYLFFRKGRIYGLCALPIIMRASVLTYITLTDNMDPNQIPPVSHILFVLQSVMLVFATAINQIEQAEVIRKNLHHEARTDFLTGILNRRYFFRDIETRLANGPGIGSSIILMDIDNFRNVNQEYGHPAGDAVLRKMTIAFQQALEPDQIFGRIGGEEFAIFLPGASVPEAAAFADKLRTIAKTITVAPEVSLSVSFGVSEVPTRDDPKDDHLYTMADAALIEAKRHGKDCVYISKGEEFVKWS